MFYVFFSLKRFSRFQNYLFVQYLWPYFVWTSSSSQITEWSHWSFYLMFFFQLEVDLHRKFIYPYERCILVSYYHSCKVKFKSIQNIVFQDISLKHIHTYIYTQICKSKTLKYLFKFFWVIYRWCHVNCLALAKLTPEVSHNPNRVVLIRSCSFLLQALRVQVGSWPKGWRG